MKRLRCRSIVFRWGVVLGCITTLALVSMSSSLLIARMSKEDAASINQSGLLRMQSYKILNQLLHNDLLPSAASQSDVKDSMIYFERLLNDDLLKRPFAVSSPALQTAYENIHSQWYSTIKPEVQQTLQSRHPDRKLQNKIDRFVFQVNHLVTLYQQNSEKHIYLLELIQIISLTVLLCFVIYALYNLKNNIAQPLKALNEAALKVKNGDFEFHVDIHSEDELGVLAATINTMSESIAEVYRNLNKKIEKETAAVNHSNRVLRLMFSTAHAINKNIQGKFDFQPIIDELSETTGITRIDLCLKTPEGTIAYDHLFTTKASESSRCLQRLCESCFNTGKTNIQEENECSKFYPLIIDGKDLGRLICYSEDNVPIKPWQDQLLRSITGCIATALNIRMQVEQVRRVALLDERSVIARELHDSLAQSLSYLNIQVTRLQKAHAASANERIPPIIGELKKGINTTYRQLRELLTTFRLGLNENGLHAALEAMVMDLRQRNEMRIELNYSLENLPLTPREEIHLMLIAREAAQNAVKHSGGDQLQINVYDQYDEVYLTVKDNGTGLNPDSKKHNHFGFAIMNERSRILNGKLEFDTPDQPGTRVLFHFLPETTAESSSARELSK